MRAKRIVHEWFTATLKEDLLLPKRGCTRKVITLADGIDEHSTPEPHRFLTANIGDRLMLFGASVDQIQMVTVTAIKIDSYRSELVISRGVGAVNDGPVHVHKVAA